MLERRSQDSSWRRSTGVCSRSGVDRPPSDLPGRGLHDLAGVDLAVDVEHARPVVVVSPVEVVPADAGVNTVTLRSCCLGGGWRGIRSRFQVTVARTAANVSSHESTWLFTIGPDAIGRPSSS